MTQTEYKPDKISHPVKSLVWRERIDQYVERQIDQYVDSLYEADKRRLGMVPYPDYDPKDDGKYLVDYGGFLYFMDYYSGTWVRDSEVLSDDAVKGIRAFVSVTGERFADDIAYLIKWLAEHPRDSDEPTDIFANPVNVITLRLEEAEKELASLRKKVQELERERGVFREKYIEQVCAVIKFLHASKATEEAYAVQRKLDEFLASLTQQKGGTE